MQYATFVDGLRARSQRRTATRRGIDGKDLPSKLPPGVAAIEYLVEDQQIRIFVMRRNAPLVCRTVRSERKAFERRVNAFVDALAARDLDIGTPSRELYDLLLRPVEAETSGAAALLIVPDGVLWRVPFAALVDRHGRFAIERAAIFYAPSITAYSLMSNAKRAPRSAQTLLAVANPTIGSARTSTFTTFYRRASLGPLPDAEREVDAVRALYDRKHSLVLEREQATERRTKSAIGTASVVHFATHALLDDANPMYSRLALAEDDALTDDGWLESWEIVRMNLDADLVVLSACETARGRIGGGEGVVGMAWSFFLAGAHATVATQWKIASASTASFMVAFHRALRDGTRAATLRKALALRDAQLKMLRDARYNHPFYWAPFVLLGDPSSR
jgi:CHAT domain-containing protein